MSMGLQIIAAVFLVFTALAPMQSRVTLMMIGLAIFLTGSGLNVTCMNCMSLSFLVILMTPKEKKPFYGTIAE